MLSRYATLGQGLLHVLQVGEHAPVPDDEAVQVREHPGGWYAAGGGSLLAHCLPKLCHQVAAVPVPVMPAPTTCCGLHALRCAPSTDCLMDWQS